MFTNAIVLWFSLFILAPVPFLLQQSLPAFIVPPSLHSLLSTPGEITQYYHPLPFIPNDTGLVTQYSLFHLLIQVRVSHLNLLPSQTSAFSDFLHVLPADSTCTHLACPVSHISTWGPQCLLVVFHQCSLCQGVLHPSQQATRSSFHSWQSSVWHSIKGTPIYCLSSVTHQYSKHQYSVCVCV